MLGSRSGRQRPLLLILVFSAFLAIIGITAAAQAVLVSLNVSTNTLNAIVASDSATVRAVLEDSVQMHYLDPATGPTTAERTALETQLAALASPTEILRVELRRLDGTILVASEPGLTGRGTEVTGAMVSAVAGQTTVGILPASDAAAGPGELGSATVLRELLPIRSGGIVRAVVGIWRDAVPLLARLDAVRRDAVLITISAGIVASLLLYLIFRAAQGRLTRQTAALVDATRRDPLTGALNHGAVVAHLAAEVERARAGGLPLGVALLDIDNFRLLNDNHGHRAGDQALVAVAGELRRQLSPEGSIVMGRYGPDEFLLVASAAAVVELEPVVDRLRTVLVEHSLSSRRPSACRSRSAPDFAPIRSTGRR